MCVDGMNFLHRARSGWMAGPAPVIFNFMRNFRALVEQLQPSRIYFVLEGHPQQRIDALPGYKANRVIAEGDTAKHEEMKRFFSQVDEIVGLLVTGFPVTVVRHPHFECDDSVYNLIKRSSSAVQWTVVSNDSDFTQLLNEFEHVKVYNPMQKTFVQHPGYDYVAWKSLRGDGSDCIPGIPGIGDKTAEKLVEDPEALVELFSDPEKAAIFTRNHGLIKFIEWSDSDCLEMLSSTPNRGWEPVKLCFERHGFKSLLKPATWEKFTSTFEPLWGLQCLNHPHLRTGGPTSSGSRPRAHRQ